MLLAVRVREGGVDGDIRAINTLKPSGSYVK
jgi:hypothetical protein